MVTAEELTLAIKSEGVGEAKDDLDGISDSMENTAETSEDAAEGLESATNRMQGVLSAAVAGMAVAVGGLLSTVPVLGEIGAGVAAIISAIGLQIDQLLRDLGAGGLSGILFDVANAINNLDGTMGDLFAIFAIFETAVLGLLAGLTLAAVKILGFAGAASAIITVLKGVALTIAGVIGGISALAAGIIVAIAAVVAFAAAYLTNWRGVRDKTDAIVGQIIDFVVSGFNSLKNDAIDIISSFVSGIVSWFNDLASGLSEWADNIASDAAQWGRNLINRFIDGIQSALGRLREWLSELRDVGAEVGIDVPSLSVGGGGGGGGNGGRRRFGDRGGGSGRVSLDGRELTESTGRYRSDPGRRRGL